MNLGEHFTNLFHVILSFFFKISDFSQLLTCVLDEDLNIASTHCNPVRKKTELTVYTLSQAYYLL